MAAQFPVLPPNMSCPYCNFSRVWVLRRGKKKCKRCRREFAAQRYPVPSLRVTEREWQLVVHTFLRQRSILRIAEETGLGKNKVHRMLEYVRDRMAEHRLEVFQGPVEMDETYIGGQRKNKKLHIRKIAGKKGHGTDKLPIVGLFCRSSGQVLVDVEPKKLDVHFIFDLIGKHVMSGAEIYTDGFKMYRGLPKRGYRHQFVDHDGGELVRGEVHTNNIEGFWGILKRRLGCIGGMRRARLHLFVAEIVWIFNHRHLSLKERERALLRLVLRQ